MVETKTNIEQTLRTANPELVALANEIAVKEQINARSNAVRQAIGSLLAGKFGFQSKKEIEDAFQARVLKNLAGLRQGLADVNSFSAEQFADTPVPNPDPNIITHATGEEAKAAIRAFNFLYNSPEFGANKTQMKLATQRGVNSEPAADTIEKVLGLKKLINSLDIVEIEAMGDPGVIDYSTDPITFSAPPTGKFVNLYGQYRAVEQLLAHPDPAATPNQISAHQARSDELKGKINELITEREAVKSQVKDIDTLLEGISGVPSNLRSSLSTFGTDLETALKGIDIDPPFTLTVPPITVGTDTTLDVLVNNSAVANELYRYHDRFENINGAKVNYKIPPKTLLREAIILGKFGAYKALNDTEKTYVDNLVKMCMEPLAEPPTEEQEQYIEQFTGKKKQPPAPRLRRTRATLKYIWRNLR